MRTSLATFLLGLVLLAAGAAPCGAQTANGVFTGDGSYYGAPGNYGMAFGTASYGVPRTYTVYSTSYGPGYSYGYAPYAFLPGHYGVGLWRPGFAAPGYVYGTGFNRTIPVPYRPVTGPPIPPPVGAYAPGLGPAPVWGW
jgi:hypothetical protein